MKVKDYTGWALLGGALIVGALAFFMVKQYLLDEESKLRQAVESERDEMSRVVVASRNLPPGAVISSEVMAIGSIPTKHRPNRVVTPGEFDALKGRVLSRPMSAGEPLLEDFVSGFVIERFSDLLGDGDRALSLEVSALETYSGMLLPGDYVDLYVLVKDSLEESRKQLVPVLERVKVIAAGRQPLRTREQSYQPLPEDQSHYDLISVAVSAHDAERIALAQESGEIKYLLRNVNDSILLAKESGRPYFGDGNDAKGYFYYSNIIPRGEQRTNYQGKSPTGAPDVAQGAQ